MAVPVAVVPAFIAGTFDASPQGGRPPRPVVVVVTFGQPLRVAACLSRLPQSKAGHLVEALQRRVAALAPPAVS